MPVAAASPIKVTLPSDVQSLHAMVLERDLLIEKLKLQIARMKRARESTLKSIHEKNLTHARAELAAKEVDLRTELTRTTERLEGVQKHVMLQVTDARDAQKRAEDQTTKASQRAVTLGAEMETLRVQLAEVESTHQRTVAAQTAAAAEAGQLRMERDSLKEKFANTTGQLEGITKQFDALSRQLSRGQKTVLAGARPQPTATNSTKNKITPCWSSTVGRERRWPRVPASPVESFRRRAIAVWLNFDSCRKSAGLPCEAFHSTRKTTARISRYVGYLAINQPFPPRTAPV